MDAPVFSVICFFFYPGEWICCVSEMTEQLRFRFQRQTLGMLDTLQKNHLIEYTLLGRGRLLKYKIINWQRHNTVPDYNCPCQKGIGFFFLPVTTAVELISMGKCSKMDILLDMCVSAVYRDEQVQGLLKAWSCISETAVATRWHLAPIWASAGAYPKLRLAVYRRNSQTWGTFL